MTVSKHEYLSALVDDEAGEFEGRRIADELGRNEDDRTLWGRYHLIGEAMRHALPPTVDMDFTHRVSAAIDAEPRLDVPAGRSGGAMTMHRLAKPVVGFAMAAGVAVVSVVTLQSFTQPPGGEATQLVAETVPPAPVVQVAAQVPAPVPASTTESADAAARLNSYLVTHAGYAPTRQGMLPQVRVVGYVAQDQD